jgi:VRR-NUC domain
MPKSALKIDKAKTKTKTPKPPKAIKGPLEYTEQVNLINWCHGHEDRRLQLIYSHLNGMRTTIGNAVKHKLAGAKKGIPDLFLPVPVWRICLKDPPTKSDFLSSLLRFISNLTNLPIPSIKIYCGLYIEMKRVNGEEPSHEQKVWISLLKQQGYQVVVCEGAEEAKVAIEKYLG